ncbi:MAG: hypothetical protein HY928_13980 [Elusimicrobia bacterium]|nr:hypothetical protein [Elusimicrobiota bacterium]
MPKSAAELRNQLEGLRKDLESARLGVASAPVAAPRAAPAPARAALAWLPALLCAAGFLAGALGRLPTGAALTALGVLTEFWARRSEAHAQAERLSDLERRAGILERRVAGALASEVPEQVRDLYEQAARLSRVIEALRDAVDEKRAEGRS